MTDDRKGPILIDVSAPLKTGPEAAPPVSNTLDQGADGHVMQIVATLGARRPNPIARMFWAALFALIGFVLSLQAWNFVTNLLVTRPILGWGATVLFAIVFVCLLILALREMIALARLRRIDAIKHTADAALSMGDIVQARGVVARLCALYQNRPDLAQGRAIIHQRSGEIFEAHPLFILVETTLLAPLDAAARREVEGAARQVATITALVPIALADVVAALTANVRMIRRIAEIYGGRGGTFGAWRLTRAVLSHLVATGALAMGDDLIGSVAGGSIVSKLSRRFGEGIINGALTARVGIAAIEVCRPLPFAGAERPSVGGLLKRALAGVFGQGRDGP